MYICICIYIYTYTFLSHFGSSHFGSSDSLPTLRPGVLTLPSLSLTASRRVVVVPAWHRNLRQRRHRARLTIQAAEAGECIDLQRLAAARELLLRHHGTRGTAIESMSNGSK